MPSLPPTAVEIGRYALLFLVQVLLVWDICLTRKKNRLLQKNIEMLRRLLAKVPE